MDKYKVLTKLGEGTFGIVYKGVNLTTNEVVAIKKLKSSYSWDDALAMSEIKSLRKLNNHPNIIKILELIRKKDDISIVFEFCDKNLFGEMTSRSKQNKPFSE